MLDILTWFAPVSALLLLIIRGRRRAAARRPRYESTPTSSFTPSAPPGGHGRLESAFARMTALDRHHPL